MGYAFISYSTKNQASADAMRELFKKYNIDNWMAPYDIPAGSEYAEVLYDALTGCSCLVLMLTDASQNSQWVKKEVNIAITNGKTVIPVKLEDVELNSSMKLYLNDQQIVPIRVIEEKSIEIQNILNSVIGLTDEITNAPIIEELHRDVGSVSAQKKIELTVWSPVNTDVYLNDKRHLVMKIDNNTGFDYKHNSINVSGEFELIFVSNGFEKIVAFDSNLIENRLDYHLNAILSKKEITASYDRDEAIEQIREEATAYAYEQLSKVGTAEDIQLLSDELEKHSSMVSKNENTDYLIAVCASALGELAVKFGKLEDVKMIFEVYENYEAKSSYGYMFEPIVKRLKDEGFWIEIDEAHFPDEIFRNYVKENFDTDKNEVLSQEEINAVTKIDIHGKNCTSLKGIEYFTALTDLDCRRNKLTDLDVSKNTALETLWCSFNQFTSLDVSKNIALKMLICYYNQLTSLDVSKNTALTYLHCSNNKLTSLDVSKNTALWSLDCNNNQLTSLDVSHNSALEKLKCENNKFTSLDVSENTALTDLKYNDNAKGFKLFGWISTICDTASKKALDGVAIDEAHFPDEIFRNYVKENFDTDENGVLSQEEINAVTKIDIRGKGCTSLKGIKYFTELTDLDCCRNKLTSLDVSKNIALETFWCSFNQLKSLDISKNIALRFLDCNGNKITSFDVSKNIALKYLHCSNNKLTSLDVSKNTALTDFYCSSNQFTSLDVSKNTALEILCCWSNKLTSLNVSKNTALRNLYCYNNQLTSLDVSHNSALEKLECEDNEFISIYVGKNTAITDFKYSGTVETSSVADKGFGKRRKFLGIFPEF